MMPFYRHNGRLRLDTSGTNFVPGKQQNVLKNTLHCRFWTKQSKKSCKNEWKNIYLQLQWTALSRWLYITRSKMVLKVKVNEADNLVLVVMLVLHGHRSQNQFIVKHISVSKNLSTFRLNFFFLLNFRPFKFKYLKWKVSACTLDSFIKSFSEVAVTFGSQLRFCMEAAKIVLWNSRIQKTESMRNKKTFIYCLRQKLSRRRR